MKHALQRQEQETVGTETVQREKAKFGLPFDLGFPKDAALQSGLRGEGSTHEDQKAPQAGLPIENNEGI